MDGVTRLRLALAATRPGARRGLASWVRRDGPAVLGALFDGLEPAQQAILRRQAEALDQRGVGALVRGVGGYPKTLDRLADAPAALFYSGSLDLLERPAVGVCGSRNVSDEGLRTATACAEIAAAHGLVSVSGYARGVDMATHVASLRAGGGTVFVLPEGIDHFRVRRGGIDAVWSDRRTLVVSRFAPTQPWTVGGAMARNSVIIGLSAALIVIEAGEQGGTLAAGSRALEVGRRVWSMQSGAVSAGNRLLLERGAVPVRTSAEFADRVAELVGSSSAPEVAAGGDRGLFDLEVSASIGR
jgi:DNA processing protein